MRLREEKITHLAHLILEGLRKDEAVEFLDDDARILREIKKVFQEELHVDEEVDEAVRRKLLSYSRKIPEGSPEWDVLYQKFFREEMIKRIKL